MLKKYIPNLIFGRESVRNPGNIVYAPMTLDLIASNKDPMTWREALDGYEADPEDNYIPTEQRLGDRGAFPMSMTDAQISALYLEAQRKGKDPVEYLVEERFQRLPEKKQTSEEGKKERKKIRKQIERKIKNDKIEQKAEELKRREIELTKRWLINAKEINISDLDLMSEKQAAQIIEQGTLDFYLNSKRLEDNKSE